jgi:CPA1 family monovalent cation:H+ antiporter
VLYQLALRAVVVGSVTVAQAGFGLLVAVAGGAALGFAGGWLARWSLTLLREPSAETTVTIAVPFAVYLAADRIGASGVLAVLVAGLTLRSTSSREISAAGWLVGRSVWQYVEFAVSGLLFSFLGVELIDVLTSASMLEDGSTLALAGAVIGALVVVRALAMFAGSALAGRRARRRGSGTPYGWRESAVASWSGMRGVVTVATALALPQAVDDGSAFPRRGEVVLVALLVVIVTLLLQGLTLAPLIRRLGVASEVDVRMDVRRLHRIATQAALERVRGADDVPDPVREAVLRQYESRLGYRERVLELVDGEDAAVETSRQLRGLLARATEAEREAVLDARRHGEVSSAAADDVLFDVEARALRYEE